MNTDPQLPAANPCSYAQIQGWERYQTFFPAGMRCTPETTPVEEWWAWSGLNVHLDRLAAPDSPIKVIVLHGAGAYGRVMAPAAVIARKYGWETVSPDLPGYGLTEVWISRRAEQRHGTIDGSVVWRS